MQRKASSVAEQSKENYVLPINLICQTNILSLQLGRLDKNVFRLIKNYALANVNPPGQRFKLANLFFLVEFDIFVGPIKASNWASWSALRLKLYRSTLLKVLMLNPIWWSGKVIQFNTSW